jgi:hypothetical protein
MQDVLPYQIMNKDQREKRREKNKISDSGSIGGQFHGRQSQHKGQAHFKAAEIGRTEQPPSIGPAPSFHGQHVQGNHR